MSSYNRDLIAGLTRLGRALRVGVRSLTWIDSFGRNASVGCLCRRPHAPGFAGCKPQKFSKTFVLKLNSTQYLGCRFTRKLRTLSRSLLLRVGERCNEP